MLISSTDAKEVKRRARALHDFKALQHAEQINFVCTTFVIQLLADGVMAANACPKASCKRRRRCAGMPFRCEKIIGKRGVAVDPLKLIDSLYWLVLMADVEDGEGQMR